MSLYGCGAVSCHPRSMNMAARGRRVGNVAPREDSDPSWGAAERTRDFQGLSTLSRVYVVWISLVEPALYGVPGARALWG